MRQYNFWFVVGSQSLYGEEVLKTVAERAEVTLTLLGESAKILGNRVILEELIYNLADNAIKYNKRGGTVKIEVYEKDGSTVLSVTDNGIGIPKDKEDRVFERFYRVDKSHSREIGGTGLGLSIVKHAATYHKARIELESEVGAGTKVTVTFKPIKES